MTDSAVGVRHAAAIIREDSSRALECLCRVPKAGRVGRGRCGVGQGNTPDPLASLNPPLRTSRWRRVAAPPPGSWQYSSSRADGRRPGRRSGEGPVNRATGQGDDYLTYEV